MSKTIAAFLNVVALIGIILFAFFLYPPSEAKDQFLFGLSQSRFAIGFVFFLLLAANIGAAIFSIVRVEVVEKKITAIAPRQMTAIFVALYLLAALTGYFLALTFPPAAPSLQFLEPVRLRLNSLIIWLFIVSCAFIFLLKNLRADSANVVAQLNQAALIAGIFLFVFFFYEHIAAAIGWVNKSKYSYWNLLADEFLKGKIYFQNPPHFGAHDLTPHNGRWYVPMPPLPALIMLPLAYFFGGANINTADFSMFFSAINGVLVFLILDELIKRGWIKLSRGGALWLVALFAFGTPHLWVGISGRVWFVSQILTVTFLALAVLLALKSKSAWMIGICIGLALAARPNSLMTWTFAFAIAMQILKEERSGATFKQALTWTIKSALPIAAAIAGLLIYNYARFDNFLDFGYTTINGDPEIVKNAQTYGIFSPHYIFYNLQVMFLYLPTIDWNGAWLILPSGAGMSIFLTTPPLIYLFQRYERKWWIIGAWVAVALNFALLVLYHNTGKDQFGYRYILDMLIPLTILLAVALGENISWRFKLLTVFSVAINIYGANWFMNG